MMTCYTSRFLLFALLLYSSSDVISALLFRGELGSCLSVPSSNPSPVGEELRRLSVDVKRAVVASILSCPEFLAFSSARTMAKRKYTNTQLNKPACPIFQKIKHHRKYSYVQHQHKSALDRAVLWLALLLLGKILVFLNKSYAGHPRFYRFRALGFLQFSLEHSLAATTKAGQ